MALNQQINSEQICDLSGHPLQADAVVLLKSLDKLLTLGSYYSTAHDQYIQAAEKAAQAIVQAIQPRQGLSLEITSEGLMILGQKIHPDHRNVRQIHDLLVPLNIARLELTTQLTAADLRQALEALQNHKLLLGQSNTFKEIVIQGLPHSVRTASHNVLENDHAADDPASGLAAVKDMMEEWSRGSGWSGNEDESERLAREFMAMVTQILANLENSGEESLATGESSGNTPVSSIDLEALRQGLQRLVEVNPSPKQLLELISHARSALDLSRDSSRADLVFQILRKDILAEPVPNSKRTDSSRREVKYKLSVDHLVGSLSSLSSGRESVPNPEHGAPSDHMAICLYLLKADPTESLKQSLLESLSLLLARPETKAEDLDPCLFAIQETLDSGLANRADDLLSSVAVALRRGQPEMVGIFWQRMQDKVRPEDLFILWPHLVNDILLGLGRQSAEASGSVLKWAGQIAPEGALGQLDRLEAMPALKRDKAAGDLFKAPLCSLFPVYAALARTRLAGWLGKGIHASMKARPFSPLIRALMAALEEFEPANLEFYLDLIAQSQAKVLSPELRLRSSVLLLGLLAGLPRNRRQEKWVPAALTSLAELEVEEALPLLNEVLKGKWLVFFRAWPQPCRDAVRVAVAEGRGGHGQAVQ